MSHDTQDQAAKALGAVFVYDEILPVRDPFEYGLRRRDWHFARYYFNAQREEVAYFIPDLKEYHEPPGLNVHEPPRKWSALPAMELLCR